MTEPKPTDLATIKTGGRGVQLATVADMRETAQIILQSGFCPDGYKTAAAVFVGLQTGAEIGLKPMQALNSICVIKGKPSLWGDSALALVRKSGLLAEFSEEVTGTGESMQADVRSVRKDANGATFEVKTTFSAVDAKVAGLWGKAGPWKSHPKHMLKYKARAFNLRDNFPDVLMGMHLAEEMIGEETEPLPAPECDTPPRGERRKKVDSQPTDLTGGNVAKPVSYATAAIEDTAPSVQPAEFVTDDDTEVSDSAGDEGDPVLAAETARLKVQNDLQDLKDEFDEKGGDDFTKWAADVLCVGDDEVENDEDFTLDMIGTLQLYLSEKGV